MKGLAHIASAFAALMLGALLFAAAFPNPVFTEGLPLMAWLALVPVFWLIQKSNIGACVAWGALYGFTAYSLFNYWLSAFHPLAGLIVGTIYLLYFAALFPLLKAASLLFPKQGYILQCLMWMTFEYIRTLGFLGYSYGILGYSQWKLSPLIQIADTFGVWGVSVLIVFPAAWVVNFLPQLAKRKNNPVWLIKKTSPIAAWGLALMVTVLYGFAGQRNYTKAPMVKTALIQQNDDPWIGGLTQYRKNFAKLRRLSDEALLEKPDLVVWSETAFVPRIYWHSTIRDNHDSWLLVKDLLDYLDTKEVPFIIGNDDARSEPDKNPNKSEKHRVDYNGVLVFQKSKILDQYRKVHLVPFTEYFPYRKELPFVYSILEKANTHFWEKGNELKVFDVNGIKFSTPICFEDTFGDLSCSFTRAGAELIVNLSNDAWSKSLAAQNQHLSMAVFRSVENRRSLVRATASGQTCAIDPNGKIIAMATPFTETYLVASVPLMTELTTYTQHEDWLAKVFVVLTVLGFLTGLCRLIYKKYFIKEEGDTRTPLQVAL